VTKRTAHRGLVLAAFAAVLVAMPLNASGGAFSANNGGVAFVRGGQVFTSTSTDLSAAINIASGSNPAVSPNGQTVAYDSGSQIFTKPFGGGTATGPLATGTEPAWSSNGGSIVYVGVGGTLNCVNASGGGPCTVGGGTPGQYANVPSGTNKDPAVSPDGTRVAFANDNSTTYQIWIANADGTGTATRVTVDGNNDSEPSWSPDGSRIAFVSMSGGTEQIHVIGIGGGSESPITSGTADRSPAFSPDGSLILFSNGGGIQQVPSSGGSPTALTGTAAGDTLPDWQDAVPVNTAAPSITPTGSFAQGDTLFASPGSWTGSPTSFSYEWQHCSTTCAPSDAENDPDWTTIGSSSSYTVQASDVGTNIRVLVTATNIAGSSAPVSSPFAGQVNGLAPVNISLPTITGTASADTGFLVASPGSWTGATPITYTYQWLRCYGHTDGHCEPIPGATSSFYDPTGDDIDTQLNVAVIATNSAGKGGASSAASPYITGTPPHNHVSPTISGSIEVGSTLTTTDGTWLGSQPITFQYQWRICRPDGSDCNSILGATGKTYVLQPGDYGSTIRIMIRGRNGAGIAFGISNHTLPILHKTLFGPAVSQSPTIAGPPRAGEVLTASPGTWTGEAPITFTYAWQRCDATGGTCKAIGGAKKPTYKLNKNDVGSTIRVAVTATNVVNTATVNSDATDTIAAQQLHRKGKRIVGRRGQLVLVGTSRDDVIFAGPGNVTIYGMGGFDQIHAGTGNDVIYLGTGGSSRVWGGPGSNTIYAANGERDTIVCGKGASHVFADAFDVVRKCTVVTTTSPGTTTPPKP
jgi:hypothetical protein